MEPESKNVLRKFDQYSFQGTSYVDKDYKSKKINPIKKIISFLLSINIGKINSIIQFFYKNIYSTVVFILLLLVCVLYKLFYFFINIKFLFFIDKKKTQSLLLRIYFIALKILDPPKQGSLARVDLIELSIRNMRFKPTRSVVTIGGMTIAVGAIVFFISIGYGLQSLVISRVAKLDELKQADITTQIGSKAKINDKSLAYFKQIPNVVDAQPVISVVGQVNYHGSVSDVAVYGVTYDYLKNSTIQPESGKFFSSNSLYTTIDTSYTSTTSQVNASPSASLTGNQIDFDIYKGEWVRVRQSPKLNAKILGYTQSTSSTQSGTEVVGDKYLNSGLTSDKWIKSTVSLWKETTCSTATQSGCIDNKYLPSLDSNNKQIQETGYFAELNMNITRSNNNNVLGISTTTVASSSANSTSSLGLNNDGSIPFINIATLSAQPQQQTTKVVAMPSTAQKEAVVNQAMLKELGLSASNAVGKTFQISFIATGDLLSNPNTKLESKPVNYTIVGVISGSQTPLLYVPFVDIRSLGISNYSQVKVTVKNPSDLAKVRQQIESAGFVTNSVADTVAQINGVFSTVRILLGLLGFVALAVASLGMFNTLTVSLLERTREVGLMKTMGMESNEVKELFLTESMIMSFFGGILGLVFGSVSGQILGVILSIFSIAKGQGYINISYTPLGFIFIILVLSLIIGLGTGIYPARRATKISALNALRYE